MILDHPGGPDEITGVLVRGRQVVRERTEDTRTEVEWGNILWQRRSRKTRAVGSLQKLLR